MKRPKINWLFYIKDNCLDNALTDFREKHPDLSLNRCARAVALKYKALGYPLASCYYKGQEMPFEDWRKMRIEELSDQGFF